MGEVVGPVPMGGEAIIVTTTPMVPVSPCVPGWTAWADTTFLRRSDADSLTLIADQNTGQELVNADIKGICDELDLNSMASDIQF